MNKVRKILEILRHDNKPVLSLISRLLLRLPFDVGTFFPITIRIQDYSIRLHSSSISLAYWCNPNARISDYTFITAYLKENDIYIDVGANIGTTLIPAAQSIKGGKAIGFEPHPKVFLYLKDNVSLNNLDNVEVHNCALGREVGCLIFSSKWADDCNSVLLIGKGIKVPVKLLDDFGDNYSKIALVKIDVEGYEQFVVEGGFKTLERTECI